MAIDSGSLSSPTRCQTALPQSSRYLAYNLIVKKFLYILNVFRGFDPIASLQNHTFSIDFTTTILSYDTDNFEL